MKICIIGTGYVGLVTGACFAQTGNTVYCVDKDAGKIARLKEGEVPIYEPGLEEYLKNNIAKNRLLFTTDLSEGINNADVAFIAVGTPQDEDGSADLKYVYQVCEEICEVATRKIVVATKSTVPVGTGDKIENLFREKLKQDFVVFSNPEFLKEGDAINDFMKPDRVVIGVNDDSIKPLLNELYAPFTHQRNRVMYMDRRSAEITKYAANAMLALRISYMNEIARFCDRVGANVNDVRAGLGSDPRIGSAFLYPGLGYGGSCFPKDVKALARVAQENDLRLQTIEACDQVNRAQVGYVFDKVAKSFDGTQNLKNKKIAVWGLAFKARTDDIRESQALKLIDLLLEQNCEIHVTDPEAMDNVKVEYLDRLNYHDDPMTCLEGAEALIVATDWNEFKSPDFVAIKERLATPRLIDARNLYDAAHLKNDLGFQYVGVGVM
ncbi:MAG: UDP-glucose/GDP-mannose dehydrogenase family protein [Deltaproteobacteria bacterium]|nr:UDP-glucose/GDP-mannose dehydrogenase family protein [Deltaproteobacteria bacterium]